VLAIGFDNEIGNTFMSYSKADRTRFIAWLKRRYGTLDALNKAWATQRWSRHLSSWDEVDHHTRTGCFETGQGYSRRQTGIGASGRQAPAVA